MIIISDTTPLHYLILLEKAELLQKLFGIIIIPEAVFREMQHEGTPEVVRKWIASLPAWVQVKTPSEKHLGQVKELGKGETEAIALAIEVNADALLMDDRKAIREARKNNLLVVTTLGILELAAAKGLIDFSQTLTQLAETNFRLPSDEIIKEFLKRAAERQIKNSKT
jgi:predicted nucleic acid-binding protein